MPRKQATARNDDGKRVAVTTVARRAPAMSETTALARTGFGLGHWFAILDAFDAGTRGHAEAARHLHENHDLTPWQAQSLAIAYERARARRSPVEPEPDAPSVTVSVCREIAAPVADVADAIRDDRRRAAWLEGVAPELRRALDDAFGGPQPPHVTLAAGGAAQLRYAWGRSTVELRLESSGDGRTSIGADTHVADAQQAELRRAQWSVALDGLKRYLGRSSR